MAVRTGGVAPYAPPLTVLHLIKQYRERGLTTPITEGVLLKASVSESLAPRTLAALKNLDLIDSDGNPTAEMEGLRRAKSDEFAPRLEAIVRNVYAEVFQYADPAKDDTQKIADAFRDYNPAGQRARMVSLFMGLCVAAGIVPETAVRKSPTTTPTKKTVTQKRSSDSAKGTDSTRGPTVLGLDPALTGILLKLPHPNGAGWTSEDRTKWLTLFTSILDYAVPVQAKPEAVADEPDDDE
jgi:Family of unknown function (DUF5343)